MMEMNEAATSAFQGQSFESMYQWGLAVIHAFQSAGNPALTLIARFFTLLGDPVLYLSLLPFLFWCVDEKRAFRLGMTVLISAGLNTAIKETLRVERPFVRDPSIRIANVDAPGFSTPSGHSQNAAAFWPTLLWSGHQGKRAFRLIATITLPLCIGLSRIYLGVHYPTDVFLGWAVGALCAVFSIFAVPGIAALVAAHPLRAAAREAGRSLRSFKLAAAALTALALNAASNGDTSMGGAVFGLAAGYILLTDDPAKAFSAAVGSAIKKAARLALGLLILAIVYLGLKAILPGEGSEYYTLCRFIRYALVGIWASWGAPRLFIRTGLQ